MNKTVLLLIAFLGFQVIYAQQNIPIDTAHWDIQARAYVLEKFRGQDAIYLQGGSMTLRNQTFLNGTIEYDVFLKENPAFPGLYFRLREGNAEHFYLRPHQSGNPDANQAIPLTKGIAPWQLYHGSKYAYPYRYNFKDWTHVKIVVNGNRAQVFLDHASSPMLSWDLFHEAVPGQVVLTGGNASGLHIANIRIDSQQQELVNFKPGERKPLENLIPQWRVSDKFEEKLLDNPDGIPDLIAARKWGSTIQVEEGTAANISRQVNLFDDTPGNTVMARVTVRSDGEQLKYFEFGYSDRVVVILNGEPVYRGNNNFRSRDYRYLGTIGLFDGVYLKLKPGNNELMLAVSENFGGWLVTGRFADPDGLSIR